MPHLHRKKSNRKRRSRKKIIVEFYEQVLKISPTVARILASRPVCRDDDNALCIMVWRKQGMKMTESFRKFRNGLLMGKYATPESITRSRRKIQEKHSHLRGKYYKERKNAEERMRNQLRLDLWG